MEVRIALQSFRTILSCDGTRHSPGCQSIAMIRSPTSLTGYSVIFLFHSSPFGRYNSIVGCNFAKLRTGGLGLDEDDGGFTGSGTGAREGPGLDDDEDAAAGACDGVAGAERLFASKSKASASVANFQPHVTPEHSTKRHPQDPYGNHHLVSNYFDPRCPKTGIQVPTTPVYREGGISLQRERLVPVTGSTPVCSL